MPMNARRYLMVAMIGAAAALAVHGAGAQSAPGKAGAANMSEREKTIRAAADALNIVRWSDIGAGATRLPGVDVVTTMEFWGSGTVNSGAANETSRIRKAMML